MTNRTDRRTAPAASCGLTGATGATADLDLDPAARRLRARLRWTVASLALDLLVLAYRVHRYRAARRRGDGRA